MTSALLFEHARLGTGYYSTNSSKALFTSTQKPKNFQDFSSHRIFRHMNGVLNIDENKN
jgi:hypothetical protein